MAKTQTAAPTPKPLPVQLSPRANEALLEASSIVEVIAGYQLLTDAEYKDASEFLKVVKAKWKFLDEERQVSVRPLNDQVKEVNDFFRPALNQLKTAEDRLKKMLGDYTLAERARQQKLLEEAAEAARVATQAGAAPEAVDNALELMGQATAAQAPRVEGITVREVFDWELVDGAQVPAEFLSVDPRKVDAAVKAGRREIPGIRIFKSTSVIARS